VGGLIRRLSFLLGAPGLARRRPLPQSRRQYDVRLDLRITVAACLDGCDRWIAAWVGCRPPDFLPPAFEHSLRSGVALAIRPMPDMGWQGGAAFLRFSQVVTILHNKVGESGLGPEKKSLAGSGVCRGIAVRRARHEAGVVVWNKAAQLAIGSQSFWREFSLDKRSPPTHLTGNNPWPENSAWPFPG